MRARTVQFVAPRELSVAEVDVAEPDTGEVLVRTLYSGISSGTELLAYRGEIDPDVPVDETIGPLGGTFSYPFRYGYSCVGVVERSKGRLAPGTLVFALHPHQDRFVCPAGDAVPLPGIDPRVATLFPLVETALQVTLDAGPVFGDAVVVMGLGAVGHLSAVLLQRAGGRVIAVDPATRRRTLATDSGIDAVAPADAPGRVGETTHGRGVPLVVEASGNPGALRDALPLLAHEGTALVASWYGIKPATLPLGAEFHRRRLTIRSTQVSTIPARLSDRWTIGRRRARVVELLTNLPLDRLATHEFAFARAPEAFALLDSGDAACIHAALVYEEG